MGTEVCVCVLCRVSSKAAEGTYLVTDIDQ